MGVRFRDSLSGVYRFVGGYRRSKVSLYVCGPTVYASAHVGHARTYLFFDILRRTLEARGATVRHVMNITDFEDKITTRAEREGTSWWTLARREERAFLTDLATLRVERPTEIPRASDYVPEMQRVVRSLGRTGRTHVADGEYVYSPDARHARRNFEIGERLSEHAVPEPGVPLPQNGASSVPFLLWKQQEPPAPSWPSRWGRGMPGWHLECFVMAKALLGLPVDVHGGGTDLVFPHHWAENELALTLARQPFARGFLHCGLVYRNGSKMAKSTGNLVSIREALPEGGPEGLRWYLLNSRYGDRFDWRTDSYRAASVSLGRIRRTIHDWLTTPGSDSSGAAERLLASVKRSLEEDLRFDRAEETIRRWAERADARRRFGVRLDERRRARLAFQSLEKLTGIEWAKH